MFTDITSHYSCICYLEAAQTHVQTSRFTARQPSHQVATRSQPPTTITSPCATWHYRLLILCECVTTGRVRSDRPAIDSPRSGIPGPRGVVSGRVIVP